MKSVRLHTQAKKEIRDAVAYYSKVRDGLGDEFEDALSDALVRVGRQPKAGAPYKAGYRKTRVSKRFPYMIFYYEYADHVWVASIYHGSREPDNWMDRKPEDEDVKESED